MKRVSGTLCAFTAIGMCVIGATAVIGATDRGLGGSERPFSDILSPALSDETLHSFLQSQELSRDFGSAGTRVAMLGTQEADDWASVALPADLGTLDSAVWGEGVVGMRIDAGSDFAPLGLSAGANYLWIDAKGPDGGLRAIMLSADGRSRHVLPGLTYTAGSEHRAAESPLGHARQWCNGSLRCLLTASTRGIVTGVWTACVHGCCELETITRPRPRPKP